MRPGDLVIPAFSIFPVQNDLLDAAVVTRILELIHEAMRNDVTISKRYQTLSKVWLGHANP